MNRPRQGWRSLLVAYGVTSTIEAIGVSQTGGLAISGILGRMPGRRVG